MYAFKWFLTFLVLSGTSIFFILMDEQAEFRYEFISEALRVFLFAFLLMLPITLILSVWTY